MGNHGGGNTADLFRGVGKIPLGQQPHGGAGGGDTSPAAVVQLSFLFQADDLGTDGGFRNPGETQTLQLVD